MGKSKLGFSWTRSKEDSGMSETRRRKKGNDGKGEGDSGTQTIRYDTSGAESFEFRAGDPHVQIHRRTKEEIAEAERRFTIRVY